jgi:hypothetical protein
MVKGSSPRMPISGSDACKGATNPDRRRPLCRGSRVDPWVPHLEPCRQSDPGYPENSLGFAIVATLTSLRGPSPEAPQESATILFALAALTNPRALLS